MNKMVHYLGLGVHKETIAVAIAPQNTTEVRSYGVIGGTRPAGTPVGTGEAPCPTQAEIDCPPL